MSTRLQALKVLAAGAMLVTGAPSGIAAAQSESSAVPSASATEKFRVTLLTKATGGFWDAMIAGAKQYATDHPNDIELTTNACKTNDDTPCQIAEIQDAVTKGAQAIHDAIKLIESRKYPLERIVTHRYPFAAADEAIRAIGGELEGCYPIKAAVEPA